MVLIGHLNIITWPSQLVCRLLILVGIIVNDNDNDNDCFESTSNTIIASMIMFSLGGDCQPGPQLWHQPSSCCLLQVCFELFLILSLPLKSLFRSHTYIFLKQQLFWFKIIGKYWKEDTHSHTLSHHAKLVPQISSTQLQFLWKTQKKCRSLQDQWMNLSFQHLYLYYYMASFWSSDNPLHI